MSLLSTRHREERRWGGVAQQVRDARIQRELSFSDSLRLAWELRHPGEPWSETPDWRGRAGE